MTPPSDGEIGTFVPPGGGPQFNPDQLRQVLVSMLFVSEPKQLDQFMLRAFGDEFSDQVLSTIVNLANSLSHSLERLRRRRKLPPIKLRCTECVDDLKEKKLAEYGVSKDKDK